MPKPERGVQARYGVNATAAGSKHNADFQERMTGSYQPHHHESATHIQKVERGRQTRKSHQAKYGANATAAGSKHNADFQERMTGSYQPHHHESATHIQKVERGRQTRKSHQAKYGQRHGGAGRQQQQQLPGQPERIRGAPAKLTPITPHRDGGHFVHP
jgi:hypothetical protein